MLSKALSRSGLQLMQSVRQSLRVQFERGPTKDMHMESLGREKAKAGGPYVKLRSWLQLALELSLRLGERQRLRSHCGPKEVAKMRAEQQEEFLGQS